MTSQNTLGSLVENVSSDADSEWNQSRERLEAAALLAAAELLAHVGAAGCCIAGHGVSIEVKTIELNG